MLTHEQRLVLALEFNKKFIASNYTNKVVAQEIIASNELTQAELDGLIYLYDEWKTGTNYITEQYVRYNGKLYKVIQAHTSQADWQPNIVPALFKSFTPISVVAEWVQPTGSHDSYNIGDRVMFEGLMYESLIDANTWSPTGFPQGWLVV